ncbi:TolC family protein [Muricauda sp. SCSIO 64092]|uniref:TolC family protein n=1 Tax=Allomuricauda sp. SCSIO 64092 TaxID=2908842 RepID=UPI001FF69C5E|nr:TolC family protein [Muricauda sp. SCSIO 64092]UOY06207.1 TolC family protein [Muricauda sp. SCSIO 64092]
MNIRIVCAIGVCMCFGKSFSQSNTMDGLLDQIAQNNTELSAFRFYMEGQQLRNSSDNNLPDLQLLGYYLPFGEHQSGDYSEFEISQSFEFPTVYAARSKWNDLKANQLETSYTKKRQELLLKAKEGLINLFVLQKQKSIETQRKIQSKKVYEQTQELFNKEQIGILDLNKAKVAWLQEQFVLDRLNLDIHTQITYLQALNGGQPLEVDQLQLDNPMQLETLETIWSEKLVNDPKLLELSANEAASLQYVTLEKNKVLPNITLGYNYQGVMGDNFSGVYGGLSIPLWSSRNKVKAAQANHKYQKSTSQVAKSVLYTQFQRDYDQYRLLFDKYNEYQGTMAHLNSEELLFKAYHLGEYSFLEYYMEVQFYRNAMDEMLQMEKQLQLLQAQLLLHQL